VLVLLAVDGQAAPPAREGLEGRLREVALTISGALDIEQVLGEVVRFAIELTGASAGSLPLYDHHFERLLPAYVVGLAMPELARPMYRGTGAIWHMIDTGELFVHNGYAADPRALPGLVARGVRAVAAAPVRAGDQLLGVLSVYHTEPGRVFSPRDVELLEMLGRHAGVALQNATRYRAVAREAERRHLLYQASLAFGAALAPEELYATIHGTLRRLMACDTIAIALYDEPAQEIDYVYLADGCGRWPNERLPVTRGLLGTIVRTGIALRVTGCDPEIEGWFGAEPFGEGEDATASLLAVPLVVGGTTVGAITAQSGAADAYSQEDLDDLEMLAATAAIALQNAHLFARVRELATMDPLTGVFNRRHFFELARLEVERCARYGRALSLLMLDADHFKQINDRYGHLAGDEVLRMIARRCQENLREVDIIGRYGGEEFLVLLPETAAPQALQVAERLRATICAEPVVTEAGAVAARVSIGVASIAAGATGSVYQLLDEVDRALYRAKAAGRNTARAS
jgi:diguanylate cyclase (GGDEF)-like protein